MGMPLMGAANLLPFGMPFAGISSLLPSGAISPGLSMLNDYFANGSGIYDDIAIDTASGKQIIHDGSKNTVVIKNININTEDDPEKIKSALMNLIIEMQEQITPRTVSRTVGEPPAQSTDTSQAQNNAQQAEGTDQQNTAQDGTQNNNQNPTI